MADKNKKKLSSIEKEIEKEKIKKQKEESLKKKIEFENKINNAFSKPKKITPLLIERLFEKNTAGVNDEYISISTIIDKHKKNSIGLDKYKYLLKVISQKTPKIMERKYWHAYWILSTLNWNNPLETWEPRGHGAETVFHSLIDHLIVKYAVPKFLYSVFFLPESQHNTYRLARFFSDLAHGKSIYKMIADGCLPVVLTRKMCHYFLTNGNDINIYHAFRHSQVKAFEGDKRLAEYLCHTPLGNKFMKDENFWFSVIQWFSMQHMLDPAEVGPLVDYIIHLKNERPTFSITGRSVFNLIREMKKWHDELAKEKKYKSLNFTKSGFKPGSWEFKSRDTSGNYIKVKWAVNEILTSKELGEEGKSMKHCVFSYSHHILKGITSIWSLRKNGERLLTIEVDNNNKRIVQARGFCNRMPDSKEIDKLRLWASENSLELALIIW